MDGFRMGSVAWWYQSMTLAVSAFDEDPRRVAYPRPTRGGQADSSLCPRLRRPLTLHLRFAYSVVTPQFARENDDETLFPPRFLQCAQTPHHRRAPEHRPRARA